MYMYIVLFQLLINNNKRKVNSISDIQLNCTYAEKKIMRIHQIYEAYKIFINSP